MEKLLAGLYKTDAKGNPALDVKGIIEALNTFINELTKVELSSPQRAVQTSAQNDVGLAGPWQQVRRGGEGNDGAVLPVLPEQRYRVDRMFSRSQQV